MMSNPLAFARDRRRNEDGFTLIELLVVVVILGILIGIAIPVYLNYRKSANDKAAQSDIRNAVSALEVCNSDGGYPSALSADFGSSNTGGNATITGCAQTIPVSSGTQMKYTLSNGAYLVFARNANGTGSATSGRYYCYSSAAGGSVKSISDGNYSTAATC